MRFQECVPSLVEPSGASLRPTQEQPGSPVLGIFGHYALEQPSGTCEVLACEQRLGFGDPIRSPRRCLPIVARSLALFRTTSTGADEKEGSGHPCQRVPTRPVRHSS